MADDVLTTALAEFRAVFAQDGGRLAGHVRRAARNLLSVEVKEASEDEVEALLRCMSSHVVDDVVKLPMFLKAGGNGFTIDRGLAGLLVYESYVVTGVLPPESPVRRAKLFALLDRIFSREFRHKMKYLMTNRRRQAEKAAGLVLTEDERAAALGLLKEAVGVLAPGDCAGMPNPRHTYVSQMLSVTGTFGGVEAERKVEILVQSHESFMRKHLGAMDAEEQHTTSAAQAADGPALLRNDAFFTTPPKPWCTFSKGADAVLSVRGRVSDPVLESAEFITISVRDEAAESYDTESASAPLVHADNYFLAEVSSNDYHFTVLVPAGRKHYSVAVRYIGNDGSPGEWSHETHVTDGWAVVGSAREDAVQRRSATLHKSNFALKHAIDHCDVSLLPAAIRKNSSKFKALSRVPDLPASTRRMLAESDTLRRRATATVLESERRDQAKERARDVTMFTNAVAEALEGETDCKFLARIDAPELEDLGGSANTLYQLIADESTSSRKLHLDSRGLLVAAGRGDLFSGRQARLLRQRAAALDTAEEHRRVLDRGRVKAARREQRRAADNAAAEAEYLERQARLAQERVDRLRGEAAADALAARQLQEAESRRAKEADAAARRAKHAEVRKAQEAIEAEIAQQAELRRTAQEADAAQPRPPPPPPPPTQAAARPNPEQASRDSLFAVAREVGIAPHESWMGPLVGEQMDRESLLMCEPADMREFGLPKGICLKLNAWIHNTNNTEPGAAEDPSLKCPLTLETFVDPVLLVNDGQVYERHAVTRWLERKPTSPYTGEALARPFELRPVPAIADAARRQRGGNG